MHIVDARTVLVALYFKAFPKTAGKTRLDTDAPGTTWRRRFVRFERRPA
jgi:hypothetical protein